MSEADIDRARLRTVRAKARLTDALTELKQRVLPGTLARNLVRVTRDKAIDAADAGVDAVKARPGVAVGAAALTALFLARKPIARAISPNDDATLAKPARSKRQLLRKARS